MRLVLRETRAAYQEERALRVVLLGDFPSDPNRIVGGPQAVLTYLVRGFQALPNIDVHVVTLSAKEKHDRVASLHGATIHYLSQPHLPVEAIFPWLQRRVHRELHEINPDLVHAHNARLFSWLAVTSGYPSVVVAHGIHGTVHQYKGQIVDRVRHAFRDRILLRHFETGVEHLICISPYIEDGYRGRIRARMHAIENPIDDAFFQIDPARSTSGRVLFAGLIIRRKHPQLLIEAAASVAPRVPFLTVHLAGGTTDERYARRLRKLVNLSGLDRNVTFLGHLSEHDVLRAYQDAAVIVLPSEQETSPMVIQQAMAAGKPVIATRTGGVPDLVDDGETGFLIDRGDARALAERLELLLTQPELARNMGARARQAAEARFRANVVARKTALVYVEILGEQTASRTLSEFRIAD